MAASVAQLGLAARLLSPVLAARVLNISGVSLDQAWYQPVLGGPLPLSVTPGAFAPEPPLRRLVAATGHASPTVLWGNVASAVNGAVKMLAAARPELGPAARTAGNALLRGFPEIDEPEVGAGFRRRSCCLIYRIAPGPPNSVCGDCVLTPSR